MSPAPPPTHDNEKLLDNLKSGLTTTLVQGANPPVLRVSWIAWDSGLRGSGLQVGDQIVAVNGEPVVVPEDAKERQRVVPQLVGQYAESQRWEGKGLADGAPLRLSVRRRRVPGVGWSAHEVAGTLRAERIYYDARERRSLGPGGPDKMITDNFQGSWGGWYEERERDFSRALDGFWQTRQGTRAALQKHIEEKARVDFVVQKYPGPFANALRADWDAVRECLAGRVYPLAPDDLAYRQLGDERAKKIAAAATAAWQAFVAARAGETIAAFPSIDPFRGDRQSVAGKLIVLPAIRPSDWVVDTGGNLLASGSGESWYFAPVDSPAVRRLYDAIYRYQRQVKPDLREDVELVARVRPELRIAVVRGGGVAGLEVEPVAALVGKSMFVDLSHEQEGISRFAGEAELTAISARLPPDDASPKEVLEAMIAAVQAGDEELWLQSFADWWLLPDEKRPIYRPYHPYRGRHTSDWIGARRIVGTEVYGARVAWVDDPRVVLRGDEFEGAPRIEQVSAEIDHIGLFDGEYRAFNSISVHRMWTLQRRDGGPWRIATQQGI